MPMTEYIIQPQRSWWAIDWRALVRYRDLIFLLVRRDFVSKYKQTILGPLWFLFQPLLTTGVYIVIFARAARLSTAGLPPVLFYLSGLLLWSYFSQCFLAVSQTLTTNANLFSKVYFPRLAVPLSVVLSNCLAFAIQFALFLCIYLYYAIWGVPGQIKPSWGLLLLPLILLQVGLLSLGIGLITASLTAKYRDLSHLSSFLVQVGMFLTPIIYPLTMVPEKWRFLLLANPLVGSIETFRALVFGTELPLFYVLGSVLLTFISLAIGLVAFSKIERTFVDMI